MSLSRKHFDVLAEAIRRLPKNEVKWELAEALGQIYRQFESDFMWGEWLNSCGFDLNGHPL